MRKILLAMLSFALIQAAPVVVVTAGEGDRYCSKCTNRPPRTSSRPCCKKLCTKIVCRKRVVRKAKGICGETYTYYVTETTFEDTFCDGSKRIWKSTI